MIRRGRVGNRRSRGRAVALRLLADPAFLAADARRPIKPSEAAVPGDQAAARPPARVPLDNRQSKFGTFFLTHPMVRYMLGIRAGGAPAPPRERPGRKGGTFALCSEPRQVWSGPPWLPGYLAAWRPRCVEASLPRCLEPSLPSQKRRTRIEPNFPPWRYRKRDLC